MLYFVVPRYTSGHLSTETGAGALNTGLVDTKIVYRPLGIISGVVNCVRAFIRTGPSRSLSIASPVQSRVI
jgi:hypothetical protein